MYEKKQKLQMKTTNIVHIISATMAKKFYSGEIQTLPTICNSTLIGFIQSRILRVMVFHNCLATEQYLHAKDFTML